MNEISSQTSGTISTSPGDEPAKRSAILAASETSSISCFYDDFRLKSLILDSLFIRYFGQSVFEFFWMKRWMQMDTKLSSNSSLNIFSIVWMRLGCVFCSKSFHPPPALIFSTLQAMKCKQYRSSCVALKAWATSQSWRAFEGRTKCTRLSEQISMRRASMKKSA